MVIGIMESYISSNHRQAVARNTKIAMERLAKLRNIVESRGETLKDLQEYERKGVYWKTDKVIRECKDWLNKTKAPQYLREDYIQKAKESIPVEEWEYYKSVNSWMSLRFGNLSSSPVVSINKDIEQGEDGNWRIKQSYIDEKIEEGRRYLNEREKKDMAGFLALLEQAKEFESRGYNTIQLLESLWNISETGIADTLLLMYNPKRDLRLSNRESKN